MNRVGVAVASIVVAAVAYRIWSPPERVVRAAPAFVALRPPAEGSRESNAAVQSEIRVSVDPGRESGSAAGSPNSVCGLGDQSAPWERRVALTGRRVEASSESKLVPVYAARIPSGVAVLVANHGEVKASLLLSIRLERGLYGVEQLTFGLGADSRPDRAERLQSVPMRGQGSLNKPVWLHPKTAAVVSIIDRARELSTSLVSVRTGIRAVAAESPRQARLIASPVNEASRRIGEMAMHAGVTRPDKIVSGADRVGPSVAHALTLYRNARASGAIGGDACDMLGRALERLDVALAELTCASLDLVPNVHWGPDDEDAPGLKRISAELRNGGTQPLKMVKIAVSVPPGWRVQPDESALFQTLRPGETVRATFTVQARSGQDPGAAHVDYSYIVRRAPKRLRLKTI